MSRTWRGEKGPGHQYWKSRSSKKGVERHPGKKSKKFTHKQERRNVNLSEDDLDWIDEDEDTFWSYEHIWDEPKY